LTGTGHPAAVEDHNATCANEPNAYVSTGATRDCVRTFEYRPLLPNDSERADSERCRSAFRGDGDRDSELMPITIPN